LETCRSNRDRVDKVGEIGGDIVNVLSQADPIPGGTTEGCLQNREQPSGAWQGGGHGSQFPEHLVPAFDGESRVRRRQPTEQFAQSIDAVNREVKGGRFGIDIPS
jgi:hypothetical protein